MAARYPELRGFVTGSRARHIHPRPQHPSDPVGLNWDQIRADYAADVAAEELANPKPVVPESEAPEAPAKPRRPRPSRAGQGSGVGRGRPGVPSPLRTAAETEAAVLRMYLDGEVRVGFLAVLNGVSKRTVYRILTNSGQYDSSKAPRGRYSAEDAAELRRLTAEAERSDSNQPLAG